MTHAEDLLIEIGTEELPPKALLNLSRAFGEGITHGLQQAGLDHGRLELFATPRRLAVQVHGLVASQPERESLRRGPALKAAFDAEGRPSKAAEGFARSCGVSVDRLERLDTAEGQWLAFRCTEGGRRTAELVPTLVGEALARLPIPRRMRWGAGEAEFVRPVHWLVLLFGGEVIEAELLGIPAGRSTRGHRFHHPEPLELASAADYAQTLRSRGRVIPEFEVRRALIREQVEKTAGAQGLQAVIDESLLDEVTALVEWPVAVCGSFEAGFLRLPAEVLVATMRDQQRYFHCVDDAGRLSPRFIAISNIDSREPAAVVQGNERVIRPRLSDAAYFWDRDCRQPLAARREGLRDVVFQTRLGSLWDKSRRLASLAAAVAAEQGSDPALARRAGELAKCDLLTALVGEFPELQGVMGRYYAAHDGEPAELAAALDEQYMPRFAGDRLPLTPTGRALAIADRVDTLVGIFAIGQGPSGDKDPFALRRAALGVVRILIESQLDLNLEALLNLAAHELGSVADPGQVVPQVFDFMLERLRGYYQEGGLPADVFDAVLAKRPARPYDFHRRIQAVTEFRGLAEAESLASANKRIRNILRKADEAPAEALRGDLLAEPAELALAQALERKAEEVAPLLARGDYTAALTRMAALRPSVDAFFDAVMVMCEDPPIRRNRLALLERLGALFLEVADISRLQWSP